MRIIQVFVPRYIVILIEPIEPIMSKPVGFGMYPESINFVLIKYDL